MEQVAHPQEQNLRADEQAPRGAPEIAPGTLDCVIRRLTGTLVAKDTFGAE